jgi:hypothetical protein
VLESGNPYKPTLYEKAIVVNLNACFLHILFQASSVSIPEQLDARFTTFLEYATKLFFADPIDNGDWFLDQSVRLEFLAQNLLINSIKLDRNNPCP